MNEDDQHQMKERKGEIDSPWTIMPDMQYIFTFQVSIVRYVEVRRKKHKYFQYGSVQRFYQILDKNRAYMLKSHAIKQCGLTAPKEEKAVATS